MRRFAQLVRCPAIRWTAALCCWLAWGARSGSAETWAERLGYPAGSRVLILHAGELGLSYETNAAVAQAVETGGVTSAAAMAPAPWFADAARWSKGRPDVDVGLELTLNSELPNYRWQPAASEAAVPSLVDAQGFLWRRPLQTASNAVAFEVEHELRASCRGPVRRAWNRRT